MSHWYCRSPRLRKVDAETCFIIPGLHRNLANLLPHFIREMNEPTKYAYLEKCCILEDNVVHWWLVQLRSLSINTNRYLPFPPAKYEAHIYACEVFCATLSTVYSSSLVVITTQYRICTISVVQNRTFLFPTRRCDPRASQFCSHPTFLSRHIFNV